MVTCTFENGNQNTLRHATVVCLVIKGGKLLLAKRAEGLIEAGKWGPVGGYMEFNETAEGAVRRETLEESGWEITNLRLLRINDNPAREERQNIDFIYIADAVKKVGGHDWESAEVKWFDLGNLPPRDQIAFDHVENIDLYKRFLASEVTLPVLNYVPSIS